jgi:cytochrome c553
MLLPHLGRSILTLRAPLAIAAILLLAGCVTKSTVGEDDTVAGTLHVCSSCHGLHGRSTNPTFPDLAGQQKAYLVAQLKAFHDKTRADPHALTYMWGMAAKLDDKTIDGVATFFSAQTPAAGDTEDPALVAAGQAIFTNGIDARNVPACMACHGEKAEGNDTIPRLAGQHRSYLIGQLYAFKSNARANDTMHQNAENLTPAEVDGISAYLAAQ